MKFDYSLMNPITYRSTMGHRRGTTDMRMAVCILQSLLQCITTHVRYTTIGQRGSGNAVVLVFHWHPWHSTGYPYRLEDERSEPCEEGNVCVFIVDKKKRVRREEFSCEKHRGLSDLSGLSEDTSPTFRFLFSTGKLTSLRCIY